MLRPLFAALLVFAALFSAVARAAEPTPAPPLNSPRIVRTLDTDWRFLRDDARGAEAPGFDDTAWRKLDVPHDWGIEGAPDPAAPSAGGGGYRPSGVSWYRQHFSVPASAADKRVFVEFDGVMGNSEVWINGQRLGARPNGHLGFTYELTGRVLLGDERANVLAVRTDTTPQPAARAYTGQGIHGPVRILITDTIRIAPWGVTVSTPRVEPSGSAVVRVRTQVASAAFDTRRISIGISIRNPEGIEIASVNSPARPVGVGENPSFTGDVTLEKADLWDLDQRRLYRAVVQLRGSEGVLDEETVDFGIREARFEAAQGFSLNGQPLKLKGVIVPHDGGAFGMAAPLRIWERRLERLRELGVNALRFPHHPPAPAVLDLCDSMGFLVLIDFFDAWTLPQRGAEQGYNLHFSEWGQRDQRDAVRRDRNHPSVIMWSAGSAIPDTLYPALAKNLLSTIIGLSHTEDPTRPVTLSLVPARADTPLSADDGLADMLDIIGGNRRDADLLALQRQNPRRLIVATEVDHSREAWLQARDTASHLGQFVASGIDGLGGAAWPALGTSGGLLDRTGALKPRAYERQSWWSAAPMVRIARREPTLATSGDALVSDWTPRDPATYRDAEVEVFSNTDEVELFLNNTSLGKKPKPADAGPRTWRMPFAPGTLRAVARNAGQQVATHELRTAGAPAKLVLTADRTRLVRNGDDIAVVTVSATDANGVPSPLADAPVTFAISGSGLLAAVDNGDPADPAPFQATARKLFRGEAVAFVKPGATPGPITLTASAPGLGEATLQIEAISPAN